MKTLRVLVTMLVGSASVAFAASGVQNQDTGILVYLFLGFFALIVVTQLVPATILFVGMVKGLFARPQKIANEKNKV